MSVDWESLFRSWSKPASDTEEERCDNATRMIKDAICSDVTLAAKNIDIFPQGSYCNNTNVRQNSDVDVCVCLKDTFFYNLPNGFTPDKCGIEPATTNFTDYKGMVERALVAKFGRTGVTRGNKACDIHENTYRVDADVVACFEHRRYTGEYDQNGNALYLSGTEFRTESGISIINWPKQHIENGVEKNLNTGGRYKFITRVLKRLRYDMLDAGYTSAKPIPSFLLECLVWNVPDEGFKSKSYTDNVQWCLAHLCNNTDADNLCGEWGEVSDLKYLFRPQQAWTRVQAKNFLEDAWNYTDFE